MKIVKTGLIFLSFVIMSISLLGVEENARSVELKAAWEPWAPYQFENEKKEVTGIDVEILRSAYEAVGYKINFIEIPWKRVLMYLKSGETNIAMSGLRTKEREEFVYFSEPYRENTVIFVVRKGDSSKYNIKKLSELKKFNFTMGIIRGSSYGEEMDELIKNNSLKFAEVREEIQNIEMLILGRNDGFVANKDSMRIILMNKKYKDKVEIHPYEVYKDEPCFMLSKKSTTLNDLNKLNEGLDIIKKNGKIGKIMKEFLDK